MAITLLDYQELLRNLPQGDVVKRAKSGDPRTWMAADELKRREEMRSAEAAYNAEQDRGPRNVVEEYVARASGIPGGGPQMQGSSGGPQMPPQGPQMGPQGPPMGPQGPPMGGAPPRMPQRAPQMPPQMPGGFQRGGPVRPNARRLAHMGRGGDTQLMHVGPQQINQMGTSINPQTGLPEASPAIGWGAISAAAAAGAPWAIRLMKAMPKLPKWLGGGAPAAAEGAAGSAAGSAAAASLPAGGSLSPMHAAAGLLAGGSKSAPTLGKVAADASAGVAKKGGFLRRHPVMALAGAGLGADWYFGGKEDEEKDEERNKLETQALMAASQLGAQDLGGAGSRPAQDPGVASWQKRIRETAPGPWEQAFQTVGQFGVGMGQSTGDTLDAVTAGFQNALQVPEQMDIRRQTSLGAEANYELASRELDYKGMAARASAALMGKPVDLLKLKQQLWENGDITSAMSEEDQWDHTRKVYAIYNEMVLNPYSGLVGRPTQGASPMNPVRGVDSSGQETQ